MILVEVDALDNEEFIPFLPEDLIRADLENDDLLFYGVRVEDKPAGAMVAELLTDRSARLRHIYLAKELRGRGYGEEMFDLMMDEFVSRGIERVHLLYFYEENPALDEILKAYEVTETESEKTEFSFAISEVKGTMLNEASDKAKTLGNASASELEALARLLLSEKDCPVSLELVTEKADPDYSFLYLDEQGPKAVIFAVAEEGEIHIPFLYSHAKKSDALFELLSAFASKVRESEPSDTRITFVTLDEKMTELIKRILGVNGKTALNLEIDLSGIRDFLDEDEFEEMEETA